MIGAMELDHARHKQQRAPVGKEAELTFMLARPALTRWQFETERLRQLASNWSAAKRRLALLESELGLAQVKALSDRIEPLTKSHDLAVRFEAQETLVALDSVGGQLGSIRERVREGKPPLAAAEPATEVQVAAAGEEDETRAVPAPFANGGDASPPRAARFEARYLEHLIGRVAGPPAPATPVPAAPDGDAEPAIGPDATFEAAAREKAYLLWEQDGCPDGRAEQYWQRAVDSLRRDYSGNPQQDWLQAPDAFAELAAALGSLCDADGPPEVARDRVGFRPEDSLFPDTAS